MASVLGLPLGWVVASIPSLPLGWVKAKGFGEGQGVECAVANTWTLQLRVDGLGCPGSEG